MWTSVATSRCVAGAAACSQLRQRNSCWPRAAVLVFLSLWIDKGIGLILGGFRTFAAGRRHRYAPTAPELGIVLGVWAIGALMITVFYKITVTIREVR